MTRIISVHRSGIQFALSPESNNSTANRFTVVIGPNASGKSRLLREIVAETLESAERKEFSDDATHQRVLAISSLVTDSFPFATGGSTDYRYLGIRQSSNTATTGSLPDLTAQSVALAMRETWRVQALLSVVRLLGFADLSIRLVPSKRKRLDSEVLRKAIAWEYRAQENSDYVSPEVLLPELMRYRDSLPASQFNSLSGAQAQIWELLELAERSRIDGYALLRVAKRVGILETQFALHNRDRWVLDHELSAGQLLLLSLVARVAAFLQPESLVVIDEPETALHPSWQSDLIPLLRDVIPPDYNSHFFLATHSPYLVSDGTDLLVPSGAWGHFEEYPDPFFGRSPETILYRVFGARVTGNSLVDEDLTTITEALAGLEPPTDSGPVYSAVQRLKRIAGDDTPTLNQIIDDASEILGA